MSNAQTSRLFKTISESCINKLIFYFKVNLQISSYVLTRLGRLKGLLCCVMILSLSTLQFLVINVRLLKGKSSIVLSICLNSRRYNSNAFLKLIIPRRLGQRRKLFHKAWYYIVNRRSTHDRVFGSISFPLFLSREGLPVHFAICGLTVTFRGLSLLHIQTDRWQ